MIDGLLKFFVVGLAYLVIAFAESTFNQDYYYLASSIAYVVCAIASVCCACFLLSYSLLIYSTLCISFSILNALFYLDKGFFLLCEGIYWDNPINLCLILESLEYVILAQGGINVIISAYNHYRNDCGGGNNFSARMGLL